MQKSLLQRRNKHLNYNSSSPPSVHSRNSNASSPNISKIKLPPQQDSLFQTEVNISTPPLLPLEEEDYGEYYNSEEFDESDYDTVKGSWKLLGTGYFTFKKLPHTKPKKDECSSKQEGQVKPLVPRLLNLERIHLESESNLHAFSSNSPGKKEGPEKSHKQKVVSSAMLLSGVNAQKIAIDEHNSHPYPPALSSATLVSFPGKRKLCLFGGMANEGVNNDVWFYELGPQRWRKVNFNSPSSAMLESNFSKQSNTEQNHGISTESSVPISSPTRSNMISKTTPKSTVNISHSSSNELPEKRCGHVAVSISSNEMLVFGGQRVDKLEYFNDLWLFKPDPLPSWKSLSPTGNKPTPRWYCTGVWFEDRLYIYGGESSNFEVFGDIHIFSKPQNKWLNMRTIHPYPPARMLHSACIINGKMIIVGGLANTDRVLSDVWSFDLSLMIWKEVKIQGPSPFDTKNGQKSLYGHQSISWGNRVLIHGGKRGDIFNPSLWMLDLVNLKWIELSKEWESGDAPSQRWKHAACADYYTHVSSKIFRLDKTENLQRIARDQFIKEESREKDSESPSSQAPAELLLQKITRLYVYGGIGQKHYKELFELTLSLDKYV